MSSSGDKRQFNSVDLSRWKYQPRVSGAKRVAPKSNSKQSFCGQIDLNSDSFLIYYTFTAIPPGKCTGFLMKTGIWPIGHFLGSPPGNPRCELDA